MTKLQKLMKRLGIEQDLSSRAPKGFGTKDGFGVFVGLDGDKEAKFYAQFCVTPRASCSAATEDHFVELFLRRWPRWAEKATRHQSKLDSKYRVWDEVREMIKDSDDLTFDGQRLMIRIGPDIDLERVRAIIEAAKTK